MKQRSLPGHIQGVYVQNILKLFTRIATGLLERNDVNKIVSLCNLMLKRLPVFISSGHIEVQERASSAYILVQMLREQFPSSDPEVMDADSMLVITEKFEISKENDTESISIGAIEIVQEMAVLFAGDLNPVAPKAQKKVPLPDGLDLDEWINPPPAESSESSDEEQTDLFIANDETEQKRPTKADFTTEQIAQVLIHSPIQNGIRIYCYDYFQLREARRIEQSHNPNYLKSKNTKMNKTEELKDNLDDIPIQEIALDIPIQITCKSRNSLGLTLFYFISIIYCLLLIVNLWIFPSATKRSDKYLDEQKKRTKKPHKKSKKNKKSKHKEVSSESEEGWFHYNKNDTFFFGYFDEKINIFSEPQPLHVVSSLIEMPEGASISDADDKDQENDDPHRALDIDLDV